MSLQSVHKLPLLLASGSPRRTEFLTAIGVPHLVRSVDADESILPEEVPEAYVRRVALAKHLLARGLSETSVTCGILAADTIVVLDGAILTKPKDVPGAFQMIRSLSGRTHQVLTAYALSKAGGEPILRVVKTDVTMRAASSAELQSYAESGDGLDKAGAYGVQGPGSVFIERIAGSYANVVGLPVCELSQDFLKLGLAWGRD